MEYLFETKNIILSILIVLQIVFFLYYCTSLFSSANLNIPSIRKLNIIKTIMKFSEAYELDFGIKIENSSYDFIINNSENSIVIDSKIAHSSMLGNIVKASLHIVTIGSRWIKNNTKIYSLVILFWYLIIFTIPFIFLYPKNNSPIWIINLLLFTITIINFIEINIKSKFKKLVLFELLHLEIIDELELSITKKLLNSWQFSNLNYSFTPLKDIYNFLRFNKNRP